VLFQTEYEGQAKKFMEVIDPTDAIVVAGGDGTVSEVVIFMILYFLVSLSLLQQAVSKYK